MEYFRIGDFARAIGVTPVTVRKWEKVGLLVPHHRSPSGYRYYSQEQIDSYLRGGDADDGSREIQRNL